MTDATGAAAPSPLTPPDQVNTLTLTAPAPPQRVAATQAPSIAPQVDASQVPALDARVDGFLHRPDQRADPLTRVRRAGGQRAEHGRRRRPQGGRDVQPAAQHPGQGAEGGRHRRGLQGRHHPAGAAAYGRGARPQPGHRHPQAARVPAVRGQGRRLLPQVPGRAEPPERHPAQPAQRSGRAGQGQRRAQHGEAEPVGRHGPTEPVRLRRRASRRQAHRADHPAGAVRPGPGQGAPAGRAVLRPAEAPGPAHPARRLHPELPGDRHHHQEQHRADQGCRPGRRPPPCRRCGPR